MWPNSLPNFGSIDAQMDTARHMQALGAGAGAGLGRRVLDVETLDKQLAALSEQIVAFERQRDELATLRGLIIDNPRTAQIITLAQKVGML